MKTFLSEKFGLKALLCMQSVITWMGNLFVRVRLVYCLSGMLERI